MNKVREHAEVNAGGLKENSGVEWEGWRVGRLGSSQEKTQSPLHSCQRHSGAGHGEGPPGLNLDHRESVGFPLICFLQFLITRQAVGTW